ncbi:nucleoside hydrolase, partial [Rhizobium ruizarguesonis]
VVETRATHATSHTQLAADIDANMARVIILAALVTEARK